MRRFTESWAGSIVVLLPGVTLLAISFCDPREEAFPAGRGVVAGAGLLFFMAGAFAALNQPPDRRWKRWAADALSILVIGAMIYLPIHLFFMGPMLARRRASQPAMVFEPMRLLPVQAVLPLGQVLRVRFDRPLKPPPGFDGTFRLSMVPSGAPLYAYGVWTYLAPGDEEATIRSPRQPGLYELRLHPYSAGPVVAREMVLVEDPSQPPRRVEDDRVAPLDAEKR
jgi:hypothetical protein